MILCQRAVCATNLYYSALKFVSFQGFNWSGDSLPLFLNPLGELFSVEVTLKNSVGQKVPGAYWERGQLVAWFQPGELYSLDMRLEYTLPLRVNRFVADFASIHPMSYSCALDFSTSNLPQGQGRVRLELGETSHDFEIQDCFDQKTLTGGESISLHEREEFRSFVVQASSNIPFGHHAFPTLSLQG